MSWGSTRGLPCSRVSPPSEEFTAELDGSTGAPLRQVLFPRPELPAPRQPCSGWCAGRDRCAAGATRQASAEPPMAAPDPLQKDATSSHQAGYSGPAGSPAGPPLLDDREEPVDLRVLGPVAGSRRVDRGGREAAGGDVGVGPGGNAGDVPGGEELFADAASDGLPNRGGSTGRGWSRSPGRASACCASRVPAETASSSWASQAR